MLPTKRMIKSMHKMRLLEMHIIVVRVLHYLFLLWPTFILLSRQVKTFCYTFSKDIGMKITRNKNVDVIIIVKSPPASRVGA